MRIMNIVWPITAWYLGPLALWTYWHIGHLNLVSQSRTGRTTTNIGVDIETDPTPHHIIKLTRTKMEKRNHSGRLYSSLSLTVVQDVPSVI
jgi:hypothetical protein